MEIPVWAVLTAVSPIVLLAGLVLASRPLATSAWIGAGFTAALAGGLFGLSTGEVAVAVARGLWTGGWILLIVLPALLLFEVLERSGALEVLAGTARDLAPTEGRQRLLLAWVLPGFLQGVAGFGTPVAMTAPMLMRRGVAPVAAVAMCLAGYQWAVTFGSMGSSYFMAAATARLSPGAAASLALRAALILATNAVVAGLVVLGRGRRAGGDLPRALVVGLVMGTALVGTVTLQPALGSTAAGLAGLVVAWKVLPRVGAPRPDVGPALTAAMPYVVLVGTVGLGLGVEPIRRTLAAVPPLAPTLPGTTAAFGHGNPTAPVTPAFEPLLHPVGYLLLATAVGVLVFRHRGWWAAGTTHATLTGWRRRSGPVSVAIPGLTVLAALMVEAGMVAAIAVALAAALGSLFVVVSPLLGTLGTVLTGSTTASNALLSALQQNVAERLSVSVPALLSGQTAGGNVGNAIAPVNVAVGLAGAGAAGAEGEVIRRNLPAAGLFLAVVVAGVLLQVALG